MQSNRVIENPIIGDRAIFHRTCRETGGKETLIEVELAPNGGNGLHCHRSFAETFTSLEGQLSLEVGGKIIRLHSGETATADRMVKHRFFNETNRRIRFLVSLTPGNEGFEKVLQIAYGMACDGLVKPSGAPKRFYDLALLATVGEMHLPGIFKLVEPFFNWLSRRAEKKGLLRDLEARYCRL